VDRSVIGSAQRWTAYGKLGRTKGLSLPYARDRRVPIGKLHTERLAPADADIRQIVARILALRARQPKNDERLAG
jgi:hypothetical protein